MRIENLMKMIATSLVAISLIIIGAIALQLLIPTIHVSDYPVEDIILAMECVVLSVILFVFVSFFGRK